MTRKDYESIAELIQRTSGDFKSNTQHAYFAGAMAQMLGEGNPRFDRARFVTACMPAWMVGTSRANVWERVARQVRRHDAQVD